MTAEDIIRKSPRDGLLRTTVGVEVDFYSAGQCAFDQENQVSFVRALGDYRWERHVFSHVHRRTPGCRSAVKAEDRSIPDNTWVGPIETFDEQEVSPVGNAIVGSLVLMLSKLPT